MGRRIYETLPSRVKLFVFKGLVRDQGGGLAGVNAKVLIFAFVFDMYKHWIWDMMFSCDEQPKPPEAEQCVLNSESKVFILWTAIDIFDSVLNISLFIFTFYVFKQLSSF